MDETSFKIGFGLLSILRQGNISSDMSYKYSSLKSQMRLADKVKAKSVIIIGEDELAKECVTLKDMASGNQEQVSIKNNNCTALISILKERHC